MNVVRGQQSDTVLNDIIVMGGSAGSISVMKMIVGALPVNFPAAVLIVTHLARRSPSVLDHILDRAGVLPCTFAQDRQEILPGQIYVAPPDRHLVVQGHFTRLVYGPRYNLSRPAIDLLFRSAAQAFGPYVIGVVLSGMLDDGAQGLVAIKEQGGTAIVQDPKDATSREMPENALRYAEIDHVLQGAEIGGLLAELVSRRAPTYAGVSVTRTGTPPASLFPRGGVEMEESAPVIQPESDVFVLSCPECGGPLSEIREKDLLSYRCLVGHGYSLEVLSELQHEGVERALWTALRSVRELIALRKHMLERMELHNWNFERKEELKTEIAEAERDALVLRRLLYVEQQPEETPV